MRVIQLARMLISFLFIKFQKIIFELMFHFSVPTGAKKIENGEVASINPTTVSRLDMDSSALHDPRKSEDASSNPANEINECSDASQAISNQGLIGKTVCSKSHAKERSSDSVSENCASPSNTSHGVLEKKIKIAMASPPANDKLHISTTGLPSDYSDCQETPALCQETACSDLETVKNPVEPISDRKCHTFSDMNCDSSELDQNPVLDSRVADNASSLNEVDVNDAHVEVLEASPLVNLSQEDSNKKNDENEDVPGSVLNHQ